MHFAVTELTHLSEFELKTSKRKSMLVCYIDWMQLILKHLNSSNLYAPEPGLFPCLI